MCDNTFNIAKYPKHVIYQIRLASMVIITNVATNTALTANENN